MSSSGEPALPAGDGGLVRLRLDIAYDGTGFSGWAVQPGLRTVQGVLQDALATLLREPARLTVAGRTDAGVHATGQVAHLDVTAGARAELGERLVHRLARILPPDVRVFGATGVPAEFDARFSALWRRYEYRVCDRDSGVDPLRRQRVLAWPRPLDDAAMAEAARSLLGLHDFAGFCKARDNGTTIRTLQVFEVTRDGAEIVCTVRADAFCHSMVRSLVGALIAVGEGRRPVGWPAEQLGRSSRLVGASVAPAHGLTLVEVAYPPPAEPSELAERARLTRARRTIEPPGA